MMTSCNSVHIIDFSKAATASAGASTNNNPLNPIGAPLRDYILQQLNYARQSPQITSVILTGGGPHFSAGADMTEFTKFIMNPDSSALPDSTLIDVVMAIEDFPKPVIAAVSGKVLGGGMEVSLSCHYRIATAKSTWGLPEVQVGMIPGAGGTQRLPRLIGLKPAMDMILTGKPMSASKALNLGLVDAIVKVEVGSNSNNNLLMQTALQWAEKAARTPQLNSRRVGQRQLRETAEQVQSLCLAASKKLPPTDQGGEAVQCALKAIQASAKPTLKEGMQVEEEMVLTVLVSPQGMARRHVFFAIRQAQKPIAPPSSHALSHPLLSSASTCDVGVLGAGTMGGGIAMVLLRTGYRKVYLVDINAQALQNGVAFLQKAIQSLVKRQQVSPAQAKRLQSALYPTTNLQELSGCQLVVEAVVERLKVKQSIFKTLDQVTQPNCVLLSNTSTLDIDQMASALSQHRRSSFAGWHFFSPAHVMQMVEIVVGTDTTTESVALLQALTKKIGKIGVVVGNCDGFCGNRMVRPYGGESVLLLAEGAASVEQVDSALKHFGMALGPLSMSDLAGNDVGYNIRRERGWVRDPNTGQVAASRPARYTELADDLVTVLGRKGQKVGEGWFDYDKNIGRGYKPLPSSEVAMFVKQYATTTGPTNPLSPTEIVERVLFALVNEGFKCLEEKIAQRPSDIDVIYVFGYGFPAWRGGPMYWADHEVGLHRLLAGLRKFSQQFPQTEHYIPSRLLEDCVRKDMMVEEYYKKGLHKRSPGKQSSKL